MMGCQEDLSSTKQKEGGGGQNALTLHGSKSKPQVYGAHFDDRYNDENLRSLISGISEHLYFTFMREELKGSGFEANYCLKENQKNRAYKKAFMAKRYREEQQDADLKPYHAQVDETSTSQILDWMRVFYLYKGYDFSIFIYDQHGILVSYASSDEKALLLEDGLVMSDDAFNTISHGFKDETFYITKGDTYYLPLIYGQKPYKGYAVISLDRTPFGGAK